MNWGGFAGGFSQGFNNGVNMAKTTQQIIKDRKISDLQEKGMEEANASVEAERARRIGAIKEIGVPDPSEAQKPAAAPMVKTEQDAAPAAATPTAVSATTPAATPSSITPSAAAPITPGATVQPTPQATPQATQPTDAAKTPQASVTQPTPQATVSAIGVPGAKPRFSYGGKEYDTREQAITAAEKDLPNAMDSFIKTSGPKIAQQYIANGQHEKAEAYMKWVDDSKSRRAIKDWASAFVAPDFDTAVTRFGKFYTDHIDDGVDYVGHKMLTKDNGAQVAVVTLKDKNTNKPIEMELTRDKMLMLGAANNPQKLFEMEQTKQADAEKARYQHALKAEERRQTRRDNFELKQYEADRQDRLKQYEADRQDRREDKKARNKIDEIAFGHEMEAVFGSKYKKTTDPKERAALIQSDLIKNDPKFPRMTPEEQRSAIESRMKILDDVASRYNEDGTPKGQESQSSAVATAPMKFDPKYPVKYEKGTGKPFHFINGKYVPIDGVIPPQAGGVPKRNIPPQAGGVPKRNSLSARTSG